MRLRSRRDAAVNSSPPGVSVSDAHRRFGARAARLRAGFDVRIQSRLTAELIEQREQFGGFLLQQDQGALVGLFHCIAPTTLPSALRQPTQTACQRDDAGSRDACAQSVGPTRATTLAGEALRSAAGRQRHPQHAAEHQP